MSGTIVRDAGSMHANLQKKSLISDFLGKSTIKFFSWTTDETPSQDD